MRVVCSEWQRTGSNQKQAMCAWIKRKSEETVPTNLNIYRE
jgi:hypothetical protein